MCVELQLLQMRVVNVDRTAAVLAASGPLVGSPLSASDSCGCNAQRDDCTSMLPPVRALAEPLAAAVTASGTVVAFGAVAPALVGQAAPVFVCGTVTLELCL